MCRARDTWQGIELGCAREVNNYLSTLQMWNMIFFFVFIAVGALLVRSFSNWVFQFVQSCARKMVEKAVYGPKLSRLTVTRTLMQVHSPVFGGRGMFVTKSRNKKKLQKSSSYGSTLAQQNYCDYSHGKKDKISEGTILMGTIYILFCVYCIGLNALPHESSKALNFLLAVYTTRKWIMLWHSHSRSNQKLDLWENTIQILRFRRLCKSPVFAITQKLQTNKTLLVWTTVSLIGLFVAGHSIYDRTCGFPGEGPANPWSAAYPSNLTMATWNTHSLTKERFDYCQNLGYDVLAINELWKTDQKFVDGSVRFTHSKNAINPTTGNPMFPNDPATGVFE